MRQVYIPLAEYTTEYRYSYYLSFLIRVFFKDVRYTKIQRREFIDTWKKYGFTKRSLQNIWDKWAYTNAFITTRNEKRNLVSLKWKQNFKLMLVPEMTYTKIKTITDFKLFITACIAGQKSKNSKWRGYNNIASKTWTRYKQTAYRRVKRAENKFGLEKNKRVCGYNGYLFQLTNVYSFWMVTYVYNKYFNSVNSRVSNRVKTRRSDHIESMGDKIINNRITKKLQYASSEMYRDINPLIYAK